MKNKNKIYLFTAILAFTTIFSAEITKADECSDCVSAYGEGWCMQEGFCANSTTEPYNPPVVDNYQYYPNQTVPEDPMSMDNINMDGAYNTDCSDYANTHAVSGRCECNDGGYIRQTDGSCAISGPSNPVECNTDGECVANYGQGFTCDYQGICQRGNSSGCLSDTQCVNSFGKGYVCDSSGTCMVDGFFDGTECKTDADCDRLYGSGFECSGVFISTCERKASSSTTTSNGGSSSPTPIATTTTATTLPNGTRVPADTTILSNGAAIDASGKQIAPAGSYDVPSNINSGSNYQLCANGILSPVCSGGGGTSIRLSPSVGNSSLGNVAGANRVNAPKCGANFKDIGGVCFPTTTGLSDAPIYLILSNIFSWLMGLFTTLAVGAFVLSGVQYTTAAGSDDQMKTAKNNAKYALIGIIVGLSGFIIVQAVSSALSGQGFFF